MVAGFNPYGIMIKTDSGDVMLAAGENITIWPQGSTVVISAQVPQNSVINNVTPWQPPQLSDANAPLGSVYYSTDAGKLVFRDYAGVVNPLY